MSFVKNMPFGARLALYVSNEVLRQHDLLFGQPELFLEDLKMEEGELSGYSYSIRATYSMFKSRDRIQVLTWIYRQESGHTAWRIIERAVGNVRVSIRRGGVTEITSEETFRVNWDNLANFFGEATGERCFQPYVTFTTPKHNQLVTT